MVHADFARKILNSRLAWVTRQAPVSNIPTQFKRRKILQARKWGGKRVTKALTRVRCDRPESLGPAQRRPQAGPGRLGGAYGGRRRAAPLSRDLRSAADPSPPPCGAVSRRWSALQPGVEWTRAFSPHDYTMLGMIRNSLFGSVETWPWQVLNTGAKEEVFYEERACEGGKFATVEVTDKPVDQALREAMPKILKYVGGTNDAGTGMGMTVPISFAVFPNEDGSLQKKLKVWFRIPNQFQDNPPVPSDKSVKLEERDSITVYSMQFGGFAKEADYIAHATQLRTALESIPATYRGDIYYCTGYDPPMKPYGRRNEVWLVKT